MIRRLLRSALPDPGFDAADTFGIAERDPKNGGQRAVFVTSRISLNGRPGGQQLCTVEFMQALRLAGFELTVVSFDFDQRARAKLKRRIRNLPYQDRLPPYLGGYVRDLVSETRCGIVFLNTVNPAPLAPELSAAGAKVVLLSHGLDSVDFLHELRARRVGPAFTGLRRGDVSNLGRQLVAECTQRESIDHVIALSPFEVEIERWLGARRVSWLPRVVRRDRALHWDPQADRLGFVGTLDHPPNREGLIRFLTVLQASEGKHLQVRVVGGPRSAGEEIAANFSQVQYLGRLSDEELVREARHWTCFLHPVFCYARGASTKLAVALQWQVPVVTTPPGCRGYRWERGKLSIGETPEDCVQRVLELRDRKCAKQAQANVAQVVQSSPTLEDVAAELRAVLKN